MEEMTQCSWKMNVWFVFFNLVGLVDAETDEEFIAQLESFKEVWDTRERERESSPNQRVQVPFITFRRKLHNIIINPWFMFIAS